MTIIKKGKEMVKVFGETNEPKKLAKIMDNFINSFSCDKQGFIENLKLSDNNVKNRFTIISLMWIKKLNYFKEINWFDGRNEYSINTAVKIQSVLGDDLNILINNYDGRMDNDDFEYEETEEGKKVPFEWIFVEQMSRTHRTLQQTFSGIVFEWLSELENMDTSKELTNISKRINENLDDRFFKTPLI